MSELDLQAKEEFTTKVVAFTTDTIGLITVQVTGSTPLFLTTSPGLDVTHDILQYTITEGGVLSILVERRRTVPRHAAHPRVAAATYNNTRCAVQEKDCPDRNESLMPVGPDALGPQQGGLRVVLIVPKPSQACPPPTLFPVSAHGCVRFRPRRGRHVSQSLSFSSCVCETQEAIFSRVFPGNAAQLNSDLDFFSRAVCVPFFFRAEQCRRPSNN